MATKSTKTENQTETDCDCNAVQSELDRVTQQLAELDQQMQAKDERIAELEEHLAKCGDTVKLQRERDHAVNRVEQLETINADLEAKVKVLSEENGEQARVISAFKSAVEGVNRTAPMRSFTGPASANRTDVPHRKKEPMYIGDGINPNHPAHPTHPNHAEWKAKRG